MALPNIIVDPAITPTQLYDFYRRNNICEANYSKERATVVLEHPSLIIGAFHEGKLVGIARALLDGLAAVIMELSVDLRFQGAHTKYANGSLVEADDHGLGQALGTALLDALAARDIDFVSCYVVESCEEPFYEQLGFEPNHGHRVYVIDNRPY